MSAATSAIVKEEHQTTVCMYCGGKIEKKGKYLFMDGREYHVSECENGHEVRRKEGNSLAIEDLVRICGQDWGHIRKR